VSCIADPSVSSIFHPGRGLAGARRILGQLRGLRAQLEGLDAAGTGLQVEVESDLDLLLLRAWASTLHADGHIALESTVAGSAAKVATLEGELHDEAEAIDRLVSEFRDGRGRRPPAAPRRRRTVRLDWLRTRPPLPHVVGGAIVLAIVVVAPFVVARLPALLPAGGAEAPASERANVLGGQAGPSEPAAAGSSAPWSTTLVTFDDWRMTAPLDPEWRVGRGAAEQVRVVAYSSAVDRSLELTTSRTGSGVAVCRALPDAHESMSVDALIEAPDTGLLLALRPPEGESQVASWVFTTGAASDEPTAEVVSVTAGEWYRLEIVPDAVGLIGWQVRSAGPGGAAGALVGEGEMPAETEVGGFCAEILDGSAGTGALIDNLSIGPNP
jgi:hypothetical protein